MKTMSVTRQFQKRPPPHGGVGLKKESEVAQTYFKGDPYHVMWNAAGYR